MSSMTPLYDSVLAADPDGAAPPIPRHPDIYQQLCREHRDVLTWVISPSEAVEHIPSPDVTAPAIPSGQSGWFETNDTPEGLPTTVHTGWFAA